MKLQDLQESESKKGTYAGVKYCTESKQAIEDYCNTNNIKNCLAKDKIHSTLLYSTKFLPNYVAPGDLDTPIKATASSFDIWATQPDENGAVKNCLVLKLTCPELVKRHKLLMDEHKAKYDFDDYVPHVTFSYDVGDIKIKDLPKFTKPLNIISEYQEDLKMDWAHSTAKEK